MAIAIQIKLSEKLFLRDPQDTDLGRRIIKHSIEMIDEIGVEAFTFKKLAGCIKSTEASIYRYFENKHLLLIYLVSWYWEWVNFQIQFGTANMSDPLEKLRIAIHTLIESSRENPAVEYVNENILHRIVISEGTKAYHTKFIDQENQEGFFLNYKSLAKRIADIILEVKSDFPYPIAIATSLIEMANDHIYFAAHLPKLTDIRIVNNDLSEAKQLLEYFAFKLLDEAPNEKAI
ncbi:MAG: TetR/AcrR family transcriptional regulator [Saprospiraceae bacterium]|nr:TetR/AcrR family transcriptional regulator [Saprospiraceae bacterium]